MGAAGLLRPFGEEEEDDDFLFVRFVDFSDFSDFFFFLLVLGAAVSCGAVEAVGSVEELILSTDVVVVVVVFGLLRLMDVRGR